MIVNWLVEHLSNCSLFLVLNFMQTEPHSMNYWLWLGAAAGTGFSIFSSTVAAIASVIKSASFSKKDGATLVLFISNFSSGMFI